MATTGVGDAVGRPTASNRTRNVLVVVAPLVAFYGTWLGWAAVVAAAAWALGRRRADRRWLRALAAVALAASIGLFARVWLVDAAPPGSVDRTVTRVEK
jgi:CHASE2 domain-containing sensor protein